MTQKRKTGSFEKKTFHSVGTGVQVWERETGGKGNAQSIRITPPLTPMKGGPQGPDRETEKKKRRGTETYPIKGSTEKVLERPEENKSRSLEVLGVPAIGVVRRRAGDLGGSLMKNWENVEGGKDGGLGS